MGFLRVEEWNKEMQEGTEIHHKTPQIFHCWTMKTAMMDWMVAYMMTAKKDWLVAYQSRYQSILVLVMVPVDWGAGMGELCWYSRATAIEVQTTTVLR